MADTRCPFAVWRGPIPNRTVGGQHRPARGLVLHVEVGTEDGTDSWFHNPAAQASADFGVAKDGILHQWVDLADKAWAQSFYNRDWYSVETEGQPTEPLTAEQVATCGRLFAWLAGQDGFPLQITDDPNGQGLITHGDLGSAGGGHIGCPGDLRSAQRPDILHAALGQDEDMTPEQNDKLSRAFEMSSWLAGSDPTTGKPTGGGVPHIEKLVIALCKKAGIDPNNP